jgi:hypothetical protein
VGLNAPTDNLRRNAELSELISRNEEAEFGPVYAACRSEGRALTAGIIQHNEFVLAALYDKPLNFSKHHYLSSQLHDELSEALQSHEAARASEKSRAMTYCRSLENRAEELKCKCAVPTGEALRPLLTPREANIVRYLTELEETRLIESSRGNVNKEDVRILFTRYPWSAKYTESPPDSFVTTSADAAKETQPHLFAVESALSQSSAERQATAKPTQSSRQRRRRRWHGRPRSRHSLETCFSFITFQKEVLRRRGIYDPEGLAESIFHTGKQDDEIDDWVAEQSNAA